MKTKYIIFAAAAVLSVGCTKSNMDETQSGDAIRFGTSYRTEVFTKAGPQTGSTNYDEGTSYLLFAVGSQSSASAYNWVTDNGFANAPQTGTESDLHAISYEPVANFRPGNSLDFYALTYGNTTTPALDAALADGTTPTITIGETSDRLPDLMHSKDVKNRGAGHGQILLPFDHATAALNFLVAKQDESGDEVASRRLEHVKLTGLSIENVAQTATMDLVTGQWTWTASNVGPRVAFPSGTTTSLDIPTDAVSVGDADILIFPNDDGDDTNNAYDPANPYKYNNPANDGSANKGEQVIVSVSLTGVEDWDLANNRYKPFNGTLVDGTVVTDGACTIRYPMRVYSDVDGSDAGPLHFLRNKRYTLSILVMRNNVRIVAVSPQVYEWVDVTLNPTHDPHVLGQPVTFGGTVWMDRNLGATSADCEHDWWHTLGYYYNYARNIPFILDVDQAAAHYYVPKKYKNDSGNMVNNTDQYLCYKDGPNKDKIVYGKDYDPKANGSGTPVLAFDDYLIYTWNQNGQKVSRVESRTASQRNGYSLNMSAEALGNIVAVNPGDKGSYAFIAQTVNEAHGTGSGLGTTQRIWLDAHENTHIRNYWYTVKNQPVPKGWRLPTGKDVYSIMPEDNFHWFYDGRRFRQVGVATSKYPQHTSGTAEQYCGDYVYQYFYGSFEVNKSATGDYSTPIYNDNNITRVYGIKYQGTSKAYRYMIEVHSSNVPNCGFVRFSMFPASASDRFRSNKDSKDAVSTDDATYNLYSDSPKWNLHKFDWDHPSSYIDFPLQGQIEFHPMHINIFGRDLKLRLMETRDMTDNYCMKLSNAGTGFYGTWHSTTCPTRLVRDVNVTD